MLVLLVAAGAFVYWRVEYALDRGLDDELAQASATIEPLVGTDGRVTSPEAADATGAAWQVLGADGAVLDAGGGAPTTPLVPASALARVDGGPRTLELGTLLPIASRPYRVQLSGAGRRPGGLPARGRATRPPRRGAARAAAAADRGGPRCAGGGGAGR